jgi:sugar lactone lactonase YvrE
MIAIRPIDSEPCRLAEGSLWHAASGRLYWTDSDGGTLHRHDPATGQSQRIYSGDKVGGFTFNRDGSIVLFRVKDVCWIDADGAVIATQPVVFEGMTRFNDVIAAHDGSVFVGTIGKTPQSGGLYHFHLDGSAHRVFSGTGCANGMGFSPDLSVIYWTCSTTRKIFAYPFRNGEIDIEAGRVLYAAPEAEKIPDGMTVDREGNIWSARWDGAQLVKISPEGKKLEAITLPRGRISCACFGGPAFDRLYVTAAADEDEGKIAPCLYELTGEQLKGRAEFLSALDPQVPIRVTD